MAPPAVELSPALVEAMVEHARREYPNEMCGLVIGDRAAAEGGRAIRWEPARNAAASPYRYVIDPQDLLRLTLETEDADEVFWAIVHSHVRSPAVPSPTDIGAAQYPDALYILVSLSDTEADPVTGAPSVRAWRILDGASHEVELRIGGGGAGDLLRGDRGERPSHPVHTLEGSPAGDSAADGAAASRTEATR